jgi:intracellular septation protein
MAATAPLPVGKQLAKLAIEIGPLAVFFIANARSGVFIATAAFMVAAIASLAASWLLVRRVPVLPLVSTVFVLGFGGLTIYLEDELFIKLKPTLVNLLFAGVLFGGLATGRSLLRYVFSDFLHLTPAGWRILTLRWALFFVVLAVLNEIVWRNFSTEFWAGFKLFAIAPLTMAFGAAQFGLFRRHDAAEVAAAEAGGASSGPAE